MRGLRIAIRDPVPVYPHSLVWDAGNAHPALAALCGYLTSTPRTTHPDTTWTPTWAQRPAR